jgi:hypothetical protein
VVEGLEAYWIARPTIEFLMLTGAIAEGYGVHDTSDPEWGRLLARMVLSM